MKVKELIEKLRNCDLEKEVVIEDADTSWYLELKFVDEKSKSVRLSGCYNSLVDLDDDEEAE